MAAQKIAPVIRFVYAQHPQDGGALAVHIPNEFVDLTPVMRAAAERPGMEAIFTDGLARERVEWTDNFSKLFEILDW